MRIHCRNESHEYECCGGCCCKRDAFIAFHSHWLNSVALVKGVCMQIRIVIGMRAHSSARSFFLHKSKVSRFELNESTFTHTHTHAQKSLSVAHFYSMQQILAQFFFLLREKLQELHFAHLLCSICGREFLHFNCPNRRKHRR